MRNLVARDVMQRDVVTVRDDMPVGDLAQFLVDSEISGAPVEDREGRLVGVVTFKDIAAARRSHDVAVPDGDDRAQWQLRGWEDRYDREDLLGLRVEEADLTAGEIMTPSIIAVDEETPIDQAARRMVEGHIHRLLVTREGKVVGILTSWDLLRLIADPA